MAGNNNNLDITTGLDWKPTTGNSHPTGIITDGKYMCANAT